MTNPIPAGFHTVTPYLCVPEVDKLIQFLKDAFNAEEIDCVTLPSGAVMHATMKVGNSMVMMGEKPSDHQAWPAMLYLYLEDVDAAYKQAVKAGGKPIMEPTTKFYGDRSGAVQDPCGNMWWVASQVEALTHEELMKRAAMEKEKQGQISS